MKGSDVTQTATAPASPDEAVARLRALQEEKREKAAAIQEAAGETRSLMEYLTAAGWKYRQIAAAVGVSGQRVSAILHPTATGRKPGRPPRENRG